jgi:hypothetical protein
MDPEIVPASEEPFYEVVLDWITAKLRSSGLPRPLGKRLAVMVAGLVSSNKSTIGEITTAVRGLGSARPRMRA